MGTKSQKSKGSKSKEHLISDCVTFLETALERSLTELEMNEVLDHFNNNDDFFEFTSHEDRKFIWALHPDQLLDHSGLPVTDITTPMTFEFIQKWASKN